MLSNQTPIEQLREQARGRWIDILVSLGIPAQNLDSKGHPCPKCGGHDRFAAFRDVAETGGVHCRHCFTTGADGIETVKWLLGCRLPEAMDVIRQQLGAKSPGRNRPKPTTFESAIAAIAFLDRLMTIRGYRLSRKWEYTDGADQVVAYVCRFDSDVGKTFRPVSLHADGWRLSDPPGPWPLYGIDQLELPDTVFVVEGEKCVDAMIELGLTAVTSAHGSGAAHKTDWSPMGGMIRVVVVPDNDEPGRKYAATVAGIVAKLNVPVSILTLPLGLPAGGDVVDWIRSQPHRTPDELQAELLKMADQAETENREQIPSLSPDKPLRRPKLIRLADVSPEAVDWLWPGRIALGKLTLLSGDPGLGKSFLTIDLAARVTTGKAWPDRPGELNAIGSVVMLSAEDDLADTIRPRLDAAGADVSRVWCLQAVRYRLEDDPEELERGFCLTTDCEVLDVVLRQVGDCRLLVVDPIGSYLAGIDSHRNAEVRSVLQPLSDLASRYDVAVVAVSHLNKSCSGPAVYRSMGSLAFTAAARAVWAVSKDPDCQARRLVLPVKNNLGADESGLAYRIAGEPPTVDWESELVSLTADDALAPTEEREERTERDRAKNWLRETLAGGAVASLDIIADAKEHGIAEKTLRRALRDIGGRPQKRGPGGTWLWSL